MHARKELLVCVIFSSAQIVLLTPPVLNPIATPLVTVSETEKQVLVLVSGITCSDPDGDVTRVFIDSIRPSHPCGRCFQIWPCEKGQGYCLMFEPSLGRLHYESVASYVVQVTCTDDVEHEMSSRIVDVQLVANSAPIISAPGPAGASTEIKPAITKRPGDLVYDVDAFDVDSDVMFYTMFTDPDNDFFDIGYADGKIRVTQDLRQMCEDSVTFRVLVADSRHAPVGPALVQAFLKKRNHKPVITNTRKEFEVPENKPFSLKIDIDDVEGDDVIFKLRADPERGLEYYAIDKKGLIKSRKTLDYEYAFLRHVDLYVDVTDGFCDADTFHVTVRITDVNEAPVIEPDYVEMTVYEGFISVDPGWTVVDPDRPDTQEWTAVHGGGGHLVIDKTTGFIHSTGELDIDPEPQKRFTFKVQVKDKGHLKDTAILRLTVLDKNDHVPTFIKHFYVFSASPCTRVGAKLGTIHARDKDSRSQGNHALVYSGSGRNISVLSTGDVILTEQCTPGAVETIVGFVRDQGTFPGPLSGVPTTLSVQCGTCPEPVTTEATTNSTEGATTSARDDSDHTDGLASNLGWIMPAFLLAMSLAGLLAYVISRHCCRSCAKRRAKRALNNKCSKQSEQISKPLPLQNKQPVVMTKIVAPILQPPETEPVLFGFWKETYVDRDQRHMPRRDVIPASVEQDQMVEEKERKEAEKEKENRRQERQKVEEKYREELEKYNQQIQDTGNGSPPQNVSVSPTALSQKKKVCVVG